MEMTLKQTLYNIANIAKISCSRGREEREVAKANRSSAHNRADGEDLGGYNLLKYLAAVVNSGRLVTFLDGYGIVYVLLSSPSSRHLAAVLEHCGRDTY